MNQINSLFIPLKALGIACVLVITGFFSLMAQAVDGGSSASYDQKILFVSAAHSNKAKVTLLKENSDATGLMVHQRAEKEIGDMSEAEALFMQYDLVVLDAVSQRESKQTYEKYMPTVERLGAGLQEDKRETRFLTMNWLDNRASMQGISMEQAETLSLYYANGGVENIKRMLDYFAYRVFDQDASKKVEPPIIYPQFGIYAPEAKERVFESLDAYLNWLNKNQAFNLLADEDGKLQAAEGQPVIGVLLQRALIESEQTQVVDTTIAELERRGALVVPFFFELSPFSSDYSHLITRDVDGQRQTFVDLIVNFRNIHWAEKRKTEFEAFGVPVMQALTYFTGDQKAWEEDSQGISANMTPFTLVLPEGAGVIDPFIVAAINQETGRAEVIDYQLEHFVNKAMNLVKLKHKPNHEKRITTMIWGNKEVGASFLNVERSIGAISERLNAEGYTVGNMAEEEFTDNIHFILEPFYRDFELDALLENDLAELMPVKEYLAWFNTLPIDVTKPIDDFWGPAEEGFMTVTRNGERHFVLPRIRNGNMLIMRQLPRSDDKDQDAMVFHSGEIPMNHFYLAAYYYARAYWNSDALIHLGTHGSQEYLGGKERGLSRYDQGNLAVWDTPVFYPFIVDDVGEAMQTKRRGSATVIAHMTPPFAAAGLQGAVADLHELMHQYKSMDEGGVREKTKQQIIDDCISNNVCADFGYFQGEDNGKSAEQRIKKDFAAFLDELHVYMEELSAENQPLGLHTYGEVPEQDLVTSTILQMVSRTFPSLVVDFEREHFAQDSDKHAHDHAHDHSHGHDHSDGYDEHEHHAKEGGGDFERVITQVAGGNLDELIGFKTIRKYVVNETATVEEMETADLSKEAIEKLQLAQTYYANMNGIQELENLVKGLSARYIPVKNGGDPVRTPEAMPTGFNLYGFDPSRLPTKAAFEQGKELVDDVIAQYYQEHGRYPDKLAFSLWSIEAMRHYGVLEAQALYAMGLKPIWTEAGRVIGTEIVPASELKRPRVDVVLSATALYRDAFPNVMQLMAKGIESIAQLKEDNNSVWDNSQRIAKKLAEQGVDTKEAEYLSTVRIFSTASGNFDNGLDAIVATDTWDEDAVIADSYMRSMGYYYGSDNSRWGKKVGTVTGADGIEREINLYGEQLSGTDVALFSRSSNLYGMISSDDPYEYFGSLALAVRNLDGKSPEMMISDLRNANNPRMQKASNFLAKELRSRNFHKRWVEEMMKEGYSGATTMSSNLVNFWGWQVVDPNVVRGDQWQEFFEVYVEDKLDVGINEWFESVNPESQAAMLETMLEANRKEYWQADAATLQKMIERFTELANQYDIFIDNEKLREFVGQQAAGFGLEVALPELDPTALKPADQQAGEPTQVQQVEGQTLEKVEQTETGEVEWNLQLMTALSLSLLFFIGGLLMQMRPMRYESA